LDKDLMMPLKDLLIALVVIIIWGVNFVVIKVGLDGLPPMLLGALRFLLVAFPAVLLVKRPNLPWRWLIAYGATISLGQFAFLFQAMHSGMPPGLASLILQSQAFFTLGFAALFLGERLRPASVLGLLVAAGGLVLIGSEHSSHVPLIALLLTLCGGAMWGMGNIITRRFGSVNLVALVVWGGLNQSGVDPYQLEFSGGAAVSGVCGNHAWLHPVEHAAVAPSSRQGCAVFIVSAGNWPELIGVVAG
jgi:O-acetylserine/cysteine efflux transporter